MEVGAVVDVMALQALVLGIGQSQSHRDAQFLKLFFVGVGVLFDPNVLRAGAMAILASAPVQLRRPFERFVTRLVRPMLLGVPACDMARDAFGVKVPCHRSFGRMDDRFGRMGMRGFLPNRMGGRMALSTLGGSDKFVSSRMGRWP